MKKRWLTLAVAATAAITVLAGCGSKTAETTAAATEAATTEAASSEAESSAEETKAEAAAEGEVPAPEGDDNKISIGVTPVPHAEIVNDVAVPKLEAAGWDVEVVEFNDYVQPNTSLEDGEIDANYFQTIRYLERMGVKTLYPCHCVSLKAKIKMAETLNVSEVGVGMEIMAQDRMC